MGLGRRGAMSFNDFNACQPLDSLSEALGIELHAQRDDLLPFPLGGNKVRKIDRHLQEATPDYQVVITNGGMNSNHCRTLAFIGAERGLRVELVLHSLDPAGDQSAARRLLRSLGANTMVVPPSHIAESLARREEEARVRGETPLIIPGGCHSASGARAYRDIGIEVFSRVKPDVVFVASGTGATHGGLVAAAEMVSPSPRVVGVSVARARERGLVAVAEAASWAGAQVPTIDFDDSFRAGGYGLSDSQTQRALSLALAHGLPLDPTYTAKAFAALMEYARRGDLQGQRVLFWHTGGLWNLIDHFIE